MEYLGTVRRFRVADAYGSCTFLPSADAAPAAEAEEEVTLRVAELPGPCRV